MISKSDLIILVLASSALAVGIFRWHQNTQDVRAITIPASSKVVVQSGQGNALPLVENVVENVAQNANAVNTIADASTQTNGGSGQVVVQPETTVEQVAKTIEQPIVTPIVVEATNSNDTLSVGTHLVQSGDYLGKIANQYGTDVQTLRDLNNISGSVIQIGQEILYPL